MSNNHDSSYIADEYLDESQNYSSEQTGDEGAGYSVGAASSEHQHQQIYVQVPQVIGQPVYTQPIITQPIYTQPMIMPRNNADPNFPPQAYLPIDMLKTDRWHAPPILVFAALLLCPPIGLILLLFFTKWGIFPKIFITLFTFSCVWVIYEIIAFYTDFGLPSLLDKIL